ncbi:related to DNA-directed RNA polymerase II elongator protein subunit [Cephalotrichum gorgonifer]|uniref:Elongator complex protein 4 n=1 Tax=Cephalotrichum gorgonifer TaxID=2041049 RepID=A0AAE8SVN2_9PEZI|nr:related to DNA-directed RNA polymerase II elongator protein subunit [Cephalotrichum gorgonifer]
MGFQRKGTVIGVAHRPLSKPSNPQTPDQELLPAGVRPSPVDGRPIVSTGTASLDRFFGGHNGLPLGTSVLVEETGATDFAGVLARYYAAEGLVLGHHVHVLGYGDSWKADLPGLASNGKSPAPRQSNKADSMKIAWRYERLDNGVSRKGDNETDNATLLEPLCHSFDLTKRLENSSIRGALIPYPVTTQPPSRDEGFSGGDISPRGSLLQGFLSALAEALETSPRGIVHRIVAPNFMSPALYSPVCSLPGDILRFMHGLRALLRRHSERTSAVITLPISLYPRASGITRWLETLSDAVFELQVLAMAPQHGSTQGLFNIHSLPIYQERGSGPQTGTSHANLSFKLSGPAGLLIEQFSLPPVEGEEGPDKTSAGTRAEKLEF